MHITISIDTSNAAFEDGRELSRILKELAFRMDGWKGAPGLNQTFPLYDINGNTVGHFEARED